MTAADGAFSKDAMHLEMSTVRIYLGLLLIQPSSRSTLFQTLQYSVGSLSPSFSQLHTAAVCHLEHLRGNSSLIDCQLKMHSQTSSASYASCNVMPTKGEGENGSVPFLSPQQGMIIFPLEAISALDRHHMGRTFHSALWVFTGTALHIGVWSSQSQLGQELHVFWCFVLGALCRQAADLMEMHKKRGGVYCFPP